MNNNQQTLNWAGYPAGLCYQDPVTGNWYPLNTDGNGNLQVTPTAYPEPTPESIGTIDYSAIGASSSSPNYTQLRGVLSRSACSRAVSFYNNTNQPVTIQINIYDSFVPSSGHTFGGTQTITLSPQDGGSIGYSSFPDINDPLDSFVITNYWADTAGTTGELEFWVTEVLYR